MTEVDFKTEILEEYVRKMDERIFENPFKRNNIEDIQSDEVIKILARGYGTILEGVAVDLSFMRRLGIYDNRFVFSNSNTVSPSPKIGRYALNNGIYVGTQPDSLFFVVRPFAQNLSDAYQLWRSPSNKKIEPLDYDLSTSSDERLMRTVLENEKRTGKRINMGLFFEFVGGVGIGTATSAYTYNNIDSLIFAGLLISSAALIACGNIVVKTEQEDHEKFQVYTGLPALNALHSVLKSYQLQREENK